MPVHWVIVSFWAWGHLRPESNLAVNLASKFPELIISFIVDAEVAQKCRDEMARYAFLGGDERVLSPVRVIALGHVPAGMTPEIEKRYAMMDPRRVPKSRQVAEMRIHEAVDSMMRIRPFQDDNGTTWTPVPAKPNLLICDVLMGNVGPQLKRKHSLPLYIYFVGSATCFTRMYAPTKLGGRCIGYEDECREIERDPRRCVGWPFSKVAQHVWARSAKFEDNLIRTKGLPPMYQWEDLPQAAWFPSFYDVAVTGLHLVQCSDGVILPTVLSIEREGVQGVADWYCAGNERQVLCLGPQLPPLIFTPASIAKSHTLAAIEVQTSYAGPALFLNDLETRGNDSKDGHLDTYKSKDPCMVFLNEVRKKYGEHRAIYISFGTTFFPEPAHLAIFLELILALEPPMPIIMAAASPLAFLPADLVQRMQSCGQGLIVPYAPQQAILAHPALGFMVTHCGAGGTFEALSQGVPVIAWPFVGDQPIHARWMTEVLDTAFELLQVRNGPVKGNAYRGGPAGTTLEGTEDTIREEMRNMLAACQ
ncbi:hypothetical protein DACRYDRAFT_93484, partial [Dacryopinax primogenitus]